MNTNYEAIVRQAKQHRALVMRDFFVRLFHGKGPVADLSHS